MSLTQEQIVEGNKMIAEFMGGKLFGPKKKKQYWFPFEWGHRIIGDYEIDSCGPSNEWPVSELQYHSSWDWLMPVVEKIEGAEVDLNVSVVIKNDKCRIYRHKGSPYEMTITNLNEGSSKIEAVWKSVLAFITWYQSQNKINQ